MKQSGNFLKENQSADWSNIRNELSIAQKYPFKHYEMNNDRGLEKIYVKYEGSNELNLLVCQVVSLLL